MSAFTNSEALLTVPALGQSVQLGMLYDARTSQLFSGLSLWDNAKVNVEEKVDEVKVQNAEFKYCKSLAESRSNAGLDIYGSLLLDLGIISAKGSGRYLSDKQKSEFEARLDVTCTVERRTRRIPQETLSSMQHDRYLDDPRFTHFVSEVTEGGSATLSFVQSCASAEEVTNVTGELEIRLKVITVGGKAEVAHTDASHSKVDKVSISYSGAMVESVTTFEDACRVAKEMPNKLSQQMNAISYRLIPISVLDSKARRVIRELDAGLVSRTVSVLKSAGLAAARLDGLLAPGALTADFPAIREQVVSIRDVFVGFVDAFIPEIRRLLPLMRDGATDYKPHFDALQSAVALLEQRTRIVGEFVQKKLNEADAIAKIMDILQKSGIAVDLKPSLDAAAGPRLLVAFGPGDLGLSRHPLEKRITDASLAGIDASSCSEDSDEEAMEWFEDRNAFSKVLGACTTVSRMIARRTAAPHPFAFAMVGKAFDPADTRKRKAHIGDLILEAEGKLTNVTDYLTPTPGAPVLRVTDQTITAVLGRCHRDAIRVTGYEIRYRPIPNEKLDSPILRTLAPNEAFMERKVGAASEPCASADVEVDLKGLFDDCDYEVAWRVETSLGPTDWSGSSTIRTKPKPSAANEMIAFYHRNAARLSSARTAGDKPWTLDDATRSLFLGHAVVAERRCTDQAYKDRLAVRIVDVAPEFRPELAPHAITDTLNTKVIVFAGTTGHGKSTEINALFSYLVGGGLEDEARMMLIDDRKATQSGSVTQIITCFRIRPLSPLFEGKTLLIVDTPGFGDTRGLAHDKFITAAMHAFFKTVTHVNSIVFTCRANEVRTNTLEPVSAYVYSLFSKNVRGCLYTVYTFSDVGEPLARGALQKLEWPVENGEAEVNNSAFGVARMTVSDKLRDWWKMSVTGQQVVLRKLMVMPPVSTDASAQVTSDRFNLEMKCVLTEKKIFRTANDANTLISNIGALAAAAGAAPDQKIEVKYTETTHVDVPKGKFTTLCLHCNHTCHEICVYSDDEGKANCTAMEDGRCTICPNKCDWRTHKNAQFIIRAETKTKMVVPAELIERWAEGSKSLEGALLVAIDQYLGLQKELRSDIVELAALTEKLKDTALRHNPESLINYIDSLLMSAKAQGATAEHLTQLTTAKKTLALAARMKADGGRGVSRDSSVLVTILTEVCDEMRSRVRLTPTERSEADKKPCTLYNKLHSKLPAEFQKNAPKPLREQGFLGFTWKGASYSENLSAVAKLVQIVLRDGAVVAALSTTE